ncbi:hypothetical protein M407DRAFT_26563 [Tulasnella calospora MUT 4182]|uniref:non-specific serine/threonine protein kinase n=1 Tax=Tulasnella calospora MUT 4182 TaxID=1051891 RepID=A0A0C3KRG5_9AGAM|nr:hypothetical protein M407DRAFT_26563 [Tulasnella calospora MUT 4182]
MRRRTQRSWHGPRLDFLPLLPDQRLRDGQFRIVRKLGWGGHSAVWLAHEPLLQRYVAIKALTAHATKEHGSGRFDEIKLLERVRAAEPTHPGHKHCSQIIDPFRTTSSHGDHICIVTEALGLDLDRFRMHFAKRKLPVPLVKRLVKQILLALDYLHRGCGIIHTANWIDKHLREEIQPLAFRAPEVVMGYPWGTPADIWSVGCLTFEYFAGVGLVPLHDASQFKTGTILDALLARILQTSIDSVYPQEMVAAPTDRDLFFTSQGLLRRFRPGPKTDLAAVLRRFGIPDDEVSPTLAFIRRCIRVKPEDRPTAQKLLQDPYTNCFKVN